MIAALLICLAPVATDGDTIKCANSPGRIRLFAIDSRDGTPEDAAARDKLQSLIGGGLVCEVRGASYSRTVAVCRNADEIDLGKALLDTHLVTEWCSYSISRVNPKGYYGTCP